MLYGNRAPYPAPRPAKTNAVNNEWNLFLLVRQRIDAGEPLVSFDILGPPLWTTFSRRPAQVRGDDGALYELGPDFPDVLHEFIRVGVDSGLLHVLPEYRLYFRPGKPHPHFNPDAAPAYDWDAAASASSASPEALQSFLDLLPPGAFLPPAPDPEADDNDLDR